MIYDLCYEGTFSMEQTNVLPKWNFGLIGFEFKKIGYKNGRNKCLFTSLLSTL
jgi:hypothetical protein